MDWDNCAGFNPRHIGSTQIYFLFQNMNRIGLNGKYNAILVE